MSWGRLPLLFYVILWFESQPCGTAPQGVLRSFQPCTGTLKSGQLKADKQYLQTGDNRRRLQNRVVPQEYLPFKEVMNEIIYDNWIINWGRDSANNQTMTQVSNLWGYYGTGIGTSLYEAEVNTGWGNRMFQFTGHGMDQEYGVGYTHHNYGVRVDQDFNVSATAVEVIARAFETGTVIDNEDYDYGQRIRVRDFEFAIRHDLDDMQDPAVNDRAELQTELFVGYKSFGTSIGTDLNDTEVGVSVGLRGREVTVLSDFDQLQTDMQANWGKGWQLLMNGDFADPLSNRTYGRLGFGKLGKAYIAVGAGFDNPGVVPEASVQVEGRNYAIGWDYLQDGATRLFLLSVSVGKFSYVWESIPTFNSWSDRPISPIGG